MTKRKYTNIGQALIDFDGGAYRTPKCALVVSDTLPPHPEDYLEGLRWF